MLNRSAVSSFFRAFGAVLLLPALWHPVTARAAVDWVLQMETSLRRDSNPFRLPEGATSAALPHGPATRVLEGYARGGMIVPLDSPSTRLILTGQLGNRRYDPLNQLNHTPYAVRASLEWRLGDLWRGDLTHRDERDLYSYINGSLTNRETVRSTLDSVEVALRPTSDIDIPLQLRTRSLRYETAANAAYNSRENSVDMGARYVAPGTQSNVRVGAHAAQVNFPDRSAALVTTIDSQFRDRELYVEADWAYSVKTRLSGRAAWLQRQYPHIVGKDSRMLATEWRLTHDYSVLTRMTGEVWRRPIALNDPNILYTVNDGAQLSVRWQATPMTRFGAYGLYEQQRYQLAVSAAGTVNDPQYRSRWGGNWVYAVDRNWRLFIDGYRESLNRGLNGAPIHQTVLRGGVEYTAENIANTAQRLGLGDRR